MQVIEQEPLLMPEYGRNVQRMVEYALTLTDKAERTRCVQAIMHTMENLFPYLKNEESRHKMYDHLAMMSGFRLDIDFPYNRPTPDELRYRPERLSYNTAQPVRYRHYGRIIQNMVREAMDETDEERRKQLVLRIANRMKQNYLVWNKDHVDEVRIKEDIQTLSDGRLSCDFPEFQLASAKLLNPQGGQPQGQTFQQQGKKKRKKKRNAPAN